MKNNSNIFIKIIGGSTIFFIAFFVIILICILMLFGFFDTNLTKEKILDNYEYASEFKSILNHYMLDGYVPLQRLLYFYLENQDLSLDKLYLINQNIDEKIAKEINLVCLEEELKDIVACNETNLQDNIEYLTVTTPHFNFPLDTTAFVITSFFNEQRIIYGETNTHGGWDLAVPAQTPVYSVCNGVVEKVNFTQQENIPYDKSGNAIGNSITIKCDEDYDETYYVLYEHLYPNSSKVKVGDLVNHWTMIANVGTTGHSTGNHLHYQVENENREKLDGMNLIDFTMLDTN